MIERIYMYIGPICRHFMNKIEKIIMWNSPGDLEASPVSCKASNISVNVPWKNIIKSISVVGDNLLGFTWNSERIFNKLIYSR